MAVGYVLLNVVPGKEHSVYLHLKDQDNVADVTVLFGDYDLIVKLVAEDLSSIATAVVEGARVRGRADRRGAHGNSEVGIPGREGGPCNRRGRRLQQE